MQWISGFFARVVKQTRRSLGLVSTGAIVAVGLILLRDTGALQPLEWLVLDYGLTWAAPNYPDDRLLLVTIDDRDVEKLGHYPLYDQDLAHAITILKGSDPVAIGLNIYRNFSAPPGSTQLLQVIEQTPELVVVEPGTPAFNRSPLAALTPEQQGIDNILVDRDGRVRRALLAYTIIQLLALAEGLSPLQGWSDPLEYLWILLWSMVGSSLAALGQFRMACNLKESEFPDSLQNPPDRGQDLGQDSLGQDLGKNLGQDSLGQNLGQNLGKNLGQDFGQRSSSYVWIATAITLILAGGSVLAIHQGLWLPALPAILSLWGSISAPGLVFCPRAATSPTFAETI